MRKNINKFLGLLIFLSIQQIFSTTSLVNFKVSDTSPTFIKLNGVIEKVKLGNENQEYTFNIDGEFLEIRANNKNASTTTLAIYYTKEKGKKNEKRDLFLGTVKFCEGIHEIYDLTKNTTIHEDSEEDFETTEPISPLLDQAIDCIFDQQQEYRRLGVNKEKMNCLLINMLSTGKEIIFKFVFQNKSPFIY